MRFCIVLSATSDVRQFRSRDHPQYFGTGGDPIDQGGTRHGGSAAWISRTSVFFQSDLENLGELQIVIRALLFAGESVNCRMEVEFTG